MGNVFDYIQIYKYFKDPYKLAIQILVVYKYIYVDTKLAVSL
jgi:hypothetical protein